MVAYNNTNLSYDAILAIPDLGQDQIPTTDASALGVGADLSQVQEGKGRVLGYYSRLNNSQEGIARPLNRKSQVQSKRLRTLDRTFSGISSWLEQIIKPSNIYPQQRKYGQDVQMYLTATGI